ncbi:hypothetical protein BH10ACT10_BH10ACT10_21310 [soil metagenome]
MADAGRLLAERHRRHRRRLDDAAGSVAGRLVGYLLGAPKPHPVWGENVWVESAGHAVEAAGVIRPGRHCDQEG